MKIIQTASAVVALLFGLMTIFVGSRVLLGSDPGYIVFQPLLIYNTTMGMMYVAASFFIFRNLRQGRNMATIIFILNLIVLGVIYFLHTTGGAVAVDSLRAMSVRTTVWLVQFILLRWLSQRNNDPVST